MLDTPPRHEPSEKIVDIVISCAGKSRRLKGGEEGEAGQQQQRSNASCSVDDWRYIHPAILRRESTAFRGFSLHALPRWSLARLTEPPLTEPLTKPLPGEKRQRKRERPNVTPAQCKALNIQVEKVRMHTTYQKLLSQCQGKSKPEARDKDHKENGGSTLFSLSFIAIKYATIIKCNRVRLPPICLPRYAIVIPSHFKSPA